MFFVPVQSDLINDFFSFSPWSVAEEVSESLGRRYVPRAIVGGGGRSGLAEI